MLLQKQKYHFGKFWVILFIGILIFTELIYYSPIKTKGAEIQPIKILPTNYSESPSADEAGWQNPSAGLVQDLEPGATFEEFNQENSAYLMSVSPLLDILPGEIINEETVTESQEISQPSIENEEQVATQSNEIFEQPMEKTLEFSDFNLPKEFSKENKEIRNVQLGLSLAFQNGTDQDNLIIEYEYNSSWYLLTEYRLNDSNSNATNNGYRFFPLPIFDNWQNLEGLKIKFIYRGTQGEIYLDALWLEVGYEEIYKTEPLDAQQLKEEQKKEQLQEEIQVQLTALKQNFKVNENPEFVLPRIETQDLFTMVNGAVSPGIEIKQTRLVGPGQKEFVAEVFLVQEGDNYKVKIKNSSDFPPGQYFLELKFEKFGQIYKTKTQFSLASLKKILEFSATKGSIETTKKLEWYPEGFKPDSEYNNAENTGINIDISSAIDSEGNEQPKLIFQGACQKEYFVILMFPGPDDYIKDPGKFIYNKAFPCQNNAYFYKLGDLPDGLAEGTYYFLVAEQGLTGPWQPITTIQPVEIRVTYK